MTKIPTLRMIKSRMQNPAFSNTAIINALYSSYADHLSVYGLQNLHNHFLAHTSPQKLHDQRAKLAKRNKINVLNGYPIFAFAPISIKIKSPKLISVRLKNLITGVVVETQKKAFRKQADADLYIKKLIDSGAIADEIFKMDERLVSSFYAAYLDEYLYNLNTRYGAISQGTISQGINKIPGDIFDWQMAVIDAGLEIEKVNENHYIAIIPPLIHKAMYLKQIASVNPHRTDLPLDGKIQCGHFKRIDTTKPTDHFSFLEQVSILSPWFVLRGQQEKTK